MSSTGEQNIFIRFITPWLGPFSNQGVGQSWLFPAEKSYLIKKIILWWHFNITLALQFTDKEGSLFLKWEWERPCAKIQSPPKRTPSAGSCCWDLELEQGELVIKVMIRAREIHLYLSFLFSSPSYASFYKNSQCFGPCLIWFSKWDRFFALTLFWRTGSVLSEVWSFQENSQADSQVHLLCCTQVAKLFPSIPFPRALTGVKRIQHPSKGAQIPKGLVPREEGWDELEIFPGTKTRPGRFLWKHRTNFPC